MSSDRPLVIDVLASMLCKDLLPLDPRPGIQFSPRARILIAGQALGRKVNETGMLFNDAGGDRLRSWLGLDREQFYNADKITILPMGFCYPGAGRNGDLPPLIECAQAWREAA